ncbi:MAG TPA: triple tyrosine motif-containing protein [Puia sp.]|nr:triple tyrosine motif-containing protein [Puia sp.]
MKKLVLSILLFVAAVGPAFCQSTIGLPAIRNFSNADYRAATEVWGIGEDKYGRFYFANNDGLLTYDGNYWHLYAMPNKVGIKSLAIDTAGRIFVGGADEIGYFSPGAGGVLKYHSLKEKLPTVAQQFADIWNIEIHKGEVFFRTNETILQWKKDTMLTMDAPENWQLMTQVDSTLFAADKDKGLYVYREDGWKELPLSTKPLQITGILPYNKDTLLVTTLKNGLYLLNGKTLTRKPAPSDPLLMNDLINNARFIGPDRYAIGTAAGGVLILDRAGKLIQRFSSEEGLQNNNVLRIFDDKDGNLWLGLANGIAFVRYNTSVRLIRPMRDNQLVSNAVRIFDHKLYIGTSNGLYYIPLDPAIRDISDLKGAFTEVGNSKGQIWALEDICGQLLIAHQDGISVLRGGSAAPVMNKQGAWDFVTMGGCTCVAGTYTGLVDLEDRQGNLEEGPKLNNLYESLPEIVYDGKGSIWAAHPYRGIFKNPLRGDFTHFGTGQGLPSNLNNYITLIRGKVVVGTEKGVYEYDAAAARFVSSAFFRPIFGDTAVAYLKEDTAGNIWFVSEQRVGVIDFSKSSHGSVVFFPELNGQTVKGAAMIYPFDKENIFIGSNNGVYHLNYSRYLESSDRITVLLGTVKAIAERDSVIFGGYAAGAAAGRGNAAGGAADGGNGPGGQPVSLPNHWNSFHFEYASPLYTQPGLVEFSYRLEGFDRDWSEWTTKAEKDYTNLPYGKYTFVVKARDNLGKVSAPASFTFIVNPAWYQTAWAYLFYLLVAVWLAYLVRWHQRRRIEQHRKKYEEEQERQKYLHSLELDRKEKGLIALQNAKLEGELEFKNRELATVTMHFVERGGMLNSIREELLTVIKRLNIPNLSYEFRSVFRMINDTEQSDDDWNRFALHFDQVHNNFLSHLKNKYPLLSPTDLKLCAYLRLNLTSKEIAQLLNISLKGVEVSRYRLRKKLNLATEVNLHDFLIEVTA